MKKKLHDHHYIVSCQPIMSLKVHTRLKSLSTCITISQDWQGLSFSKLMPLILLRFPASEADTTGEDIDDALSRRICLICGRNRPPNTN